MAIGCHKHNDCFTCPFDDCIYDERQDKRPARREVVAVKDGKDIGVYRSIVQTAIAVNIPLHTLEYHIYKYGYLKRDGVYYIPTDKRGKINFNIRPKESHKRHVRPIVAVKDGLVVGNFDTIKELALVIGRPIQTVGYHIRRNGIITRDGVKYIPADKWEGAAV